MLVSVNTPCRVLLPFLGSVAPVVRKYEFLKTLHLLSGLLFHIQAEAAKGEQQIRSSSVQKLV